MHLAAASLRRVGIAMLVIVPSLSLQSAGLQSALAQALDFRDPAKAPPSWAQFAKLVKFRFEEWIEAEDEVATRFRSYLKNRGAADLPPQSLVVKAWLNPDGTVEQVSFALLVMPTPPGICAPS